MPKENPTDQNIKQTGVMPRTNQLPSVRLTGWVSEVRQIPVKEERRVLWYASDE